MSRRHRGVFSVGGLTGFRFGTETAPEPEECLAVARQETRFKHCSRRLSFWHSLTGHKNGKGDPRHLYWPVVSPPGPLPLSGASQQKHLSLNCRPLEFIGMPGSGRFASLGRHRLTQLPERSAAARRLLQSSRRAVPDSAAGPDIVPILADTWLRLGREQPALAAERWGPHAPCVLSLAGNPAAPSPRCRLPFFPVLCWWSPRSAFDAAGGASSGWSYHSEHESYRLVASSPRSHVWLQKLSSSLVNDKLTLSQSPPWAIFSS